VTPIDREDIHALAKSLDDVMDMIDASAKLFPLYKIGRVRYGARELARVVSVSIDQVRLALEALEKRTGVAQRAVEINRLENEPDIGLHEEAVRPAVRGRTRSDHDHEVEGNPRLPRGGEPDRCEDVANLLEGVVVKETP